jgi:ABC-type glycerol-3-phosphate transport system substrate-binding protein
MRGKYLPVVFIVLLFVAACDFLGNSGEAETTLVTATPTLDSSTPLPEGTPEASGPITPTETNLTLTVWLPPEIANRTAAGTAVLEQQWLSFRLARPDVILTVEQKNVSGQGGILNYLRTGRNVAPSVLPDLIALPTNQLVAAANEELIYPVGDWLDPNLAEDLYPAARRLGQANEHLIGYPFALFNLPHLAYHSELLTDTLPLTWGELISDVEAQFVFPAAGPAGASLLLQFYLASGGEVVNETEQPALQLEPLTNALTQFSQAQDNGFLVVGSNSMTTVDEAWQLFQGNSSLIVLTTAGQFLSLRSEDFEPVFVPVPGLEEPLKPLLDGWAWAISTSDPARRTLALELLANLTTDENLGEWSFANNMLPAQRGAFVFWPTEDAYSQFVQSELEQADAFPSSVNSDILTIFQDALLNVTSLGISPQAAAEQALMDLQP